MSRARTGLLRRFTLGAGPSARPSDRLQLAGRLVVALSVLAAPPLAVATASATTEHYAALSAAQAAERSEVRAVLLEDAPAPTAAEVEAGDLSSAARAVWTAPGGSVREGAVDVGPGTPEGTAVLIWVDRDGDPTQAPLDADDIPAAATARAVLVLVGLPLGAGFAHALLCTALDAVRENRWTREWAVVAPRWTSEFR
ncbi:hypothetical protein ACI78T_02865 [Blastococcus sp. SYSU D00922]